MIMYNFSVLSYGNTWAIIVPVVLSIETVPGVEQLFVRGAAEMDGSWLTRVKEMPSIILFILFTKYQSECRRECCVIVYRRGRW